MSKFAAVEVAEFCLQGRLLDFVIEDGYKLKGLRLATSDGECYVKLARHLRMAFNLQIPLGTPLQVTGTKKYHPKKNQVTLKAEQVMSCSIPPLTKSPHQSRSVILVCQKSDCVQRGSQLLCQALQRELGDRHLTDRIAIKSTGCMKNCKSGPNLVMPDKTRYSKVNLAQIPALIAKHFTKDQTTQSGSFELD
jgi:(2Fe-2S) ferredoxin